MSNSRQIRRLCMAGVLVAAGVVCSAFYIPVGASKCFPVQHMINVLGGVILGPWYACSMAFVTSLIRVLTGTGSLLAFPGSMIGALCCGLMYQHTQKLPMAYLGELVGTGIIGAMAAYPVATLLMGRQAALFAYVIPFMVSCAGGATISILALGALRRTHLLGSWQLALGVKK